MQVNLPYLKCLVWFWVTSNPVYFVWGFRCPSWPATQNNDGIEKVDWSKNILSNDKKMQNILKWTCVWAERIHLWWQERLQCPSNWSWKASHQSRIRGHEPKEGRNKLLSKKNPLLVELSHSKLHQSFGICKKGLCIGYIPATVCPCLDCGVYRSCPYNSSALLLEGLNHHTVHC